MTITRLLSFLFAVCFAGTAQAEIGWSVVGSNCVPDAVNVTVKNYRTDIASVQFAAGKTGPIVLNCQIERVNSGTSSWVLDLTYQDSTGQATTAGVRATLYRMMVNTGTPIAMAIANSNSSAQVGINSVTSPMFNHTFVEANTYWVRVVLERTATNQTVIFHSLSLESAAISDIRLKHDIALLGRLDNGLGFYRFSYNDSDKAYVGVMAQEVEAIMPDAVVRGEDGYLRVLYGRLGLHLQSWEDWVAAGQKLPGKQDQATSN